MSNSSQLFNIQEPQAGTLQGSHGHAHPQSQPQSQLHLQADFSNPQIGHFAFSGVTKAWQPEAGQAPPIIAGAELHGQAAIALLNEHVAIPTAIAAATVSFLIVIFTSLCLLKVYL
jgi:hypothetical protein